MKEAKKPDVNLVPANGEEPLAVEIIEQSIVEIARAMKAINDTRLTRASIVTLIHARSGIGKGAIEIVLNNLEQMERAWLKPRKETR